MTDYFPTTSTRISRPRKHRCPENGLEYSNVPIKTILHHVSVPWVREIKEQSYYFCEDPDCNVVYFGRDNTIIEKSDLRQPVWSKTKSPNSLVCYCFGVTQSDALKEPGIKEYVTKKTKENMCSCETSNPSGRCCLKDFLTEDRST